MSHGKHEKKTKKQPPALTWVSRQVLEVHGLADLAVRGPAELHLDSNGLREVSVAVWRRAEHDGHLSVDVGLGERALSLPGVLEEAHLDVLCQGDRKQEMWKFLPLTHTPLTELHHACCDATPNSMTPCRPFN